MTKHDADELEQPKKRLTKAANTKPDRLDLSTIVARMDHTTLILALIAANPDLDDILPNDPALKNDVADIRKTMAEHRLKFDEHPGQINRVVEQHVHVHLWDQHTSDRLKALGASVVGLFKRAKDKMIEAKVKLIDNDDREVMTVEEAFDGFKNGFRDMVNFVVGDIPIGKIGLAMLGAVPLPTETSTRSAWPTPPRPTKEEADALRVALSAVNDIYDAQLKKVADPIVIVGADQDDDTAYIVKSTSFSSPHYVTAIPGKDSYNRADAAVFTRDEAVGIADELSREAEENGHAQRYEIEKATVSPSNNLHYGIRH